jgi:hypothetical protein
MRFDQLKSKQRQLREGFPQDLGLRVHRSISWIGRAEKEAQDHDAAFVFLWIAFNAAYADERDVDSDRSLGDRRQFVELIDRLVAHDEEGRLYGVVWDRFRGPISKLMENRFVYRPFWLNQNGIAGNEDWAKRFRSSAERFVRAMADRETAYVLRQVFDRLYMLRCQMMHGGATWNGKVNRQQVRDAADILRVVMPVIVDIMMDNPEEDWGQPFYPVVTAPAQRGAARPDRI